MLNWRRWMGLTGCVGTSVLIFAVPVSALSTPGESVAVPYFRAEGCPHCEDAGRFLRRLAADAPRIVIQDYEIELDDTGRALFTKVIDALKLTQMSVPAHRRLP